MNNHSSEDNFRLRYTSGAILVGKYSFAQIENKNYQLPQEMKSFSERCSIKEKQKCGIHFFIDDKRFECLWTNCDKYINQLKEYQLVIGPDFSLYRDMELWRRIYNCGRNYAIVYYLQKNGVHIIPTLSWAYLSDLDWSLDGLQKKCTIALSSNGCLRDPSSRQILIAGIDIIQRKIEPQSIIICGKELSELSKYKNIQFFPNFSESKFKEKK